MYAKKMHQLIGHGGLRHQAIVGIDADAKPGAKVVQRRVILVSGHRPGLHVAGGTHLQRDRVFDEALKQRGIVAQLGPVSDSVCAAVEGVGHGLGAGNLTRMQGQSEPGSFDSSERRSVHATGVLSLDSCEIKADDAALFPTHGQLREALAVLLGAVPHRAHQNSKGYPEASLPFGQPHPDRLKHIGRAESSLTMQVWAKPNLKVMNALAGGIFDEFLSHSSQAGRGLKNGKTALETPKVIFQRPANRPQLELGPNRVQIAPG